MKTLIEIRNELAKRQGNNHTHPELRSMYPQTSRGDMSRQFAHLYTLGFDDGANAVMEQAQNLIDSLKFLDEDIDMDNEAVVSMRFLQMIKAREEWQEFVGSQK